MLIPGRFLWVWECKDYDSYVPVDDIEEFWAKLQQIGGVNVKGGVVTSGPLQKSALSYAIAKGMSVVRLSKTQEKISFEANKQRLSWVAYDRSSSDKVIRNLSESSASRQQDLKKCIEVLTSKRLQRIEAGFCGISKQNVYADWYHLLSSPLCQNG